MYDFVYKHKRWLQIALLVLIVPPFALFGIDFYFRNTDTGGSLAKVGDARISEDAEDLAKHVTDVVAPALDAFAEGIASVEWSKEAIAALIKEVLKAQGLKMPQLAMPVRVLTLGTAHTPSVDAVLELLGREKILARLKNR